MPLAEALRQLSEIFKNNNIPQASREAELLLREILKISLTDLVLRGEQMIDPPAWSKLLDAAERRLGGEPLAYIAGTQSFYKYSFFVNHDVLIPRPETELIVEQALKIPEVRTIVDLGCGSGCIGLSLLCEWPSSQLIAMDVSAGAIAVAQKNAQNLSVDNRVTFVLGNVEKQSVENPVDLVVSNPPYIDPHDERLEAHVKNFEPHQALFAPDNGLYFYQRWTTWAFKNLKHGGTLIYEVGDGQAAEVQSICLQNGFKNIKIIKDLSNKERVVEAQKDAHG